MTPKTKACNPDSYATVSPDSLGAVVFTFLLRPCHAIDTSRSSQDHTPQRFESDFICPLPQTTRTSTRIESCSARRTHPRASLTLILHLPYAKILGLPSRFCGNEEVYEDIKDSRECTRNTKALRMRMPAIEDTRQELQHARSRSRERSASIANSSSSKYLRVQHARVFGHVFRRENPF